MATRSSFRPGNRLAAARALEGPRLDWAFTVIALWMIGGIAWDFHVHAEGISFAEEGFFTAQHLTFYSAFAAIALLVALTTYANVRDGQPLRNAVPRGYGFGALGVGAFALVFGLLGLLVTAVGSQFEFLPAMVVTGVVADGFYAAVRDRWPLRRTARLLGGALPVTLFGLYFVIVAVEYGLVRSVHVWTGGIVSAGLVDLLVSYVVVPSRSPSNGSRAHR